MGIIERLKKLFGIKPKEEVVPAPPVPLPPPAPPVVKPPIEITKVKGIGPKKGGSVEELRNSYS